MNTMNTIITFSDWISLISLLLAIISFVFSKRTRKKLDKQQLEINAYMLSNLKEAEINKKKANIEARVIKISKGSYRLKVWNSGNETAYNVEVSIPKEYSVIIMKDKMPFEYLEPGNSFEECVVIHMQSAPKFKVISKWEDEMGNEFLNEQLRSC